MPPWPRASLSQVFPTSCCLFQVRSHNFWRPKSNERRLETWPSRISTRFGQGAACEVLPRPSTRPLGPADGQSSSAERKTPERSVLEDCVGLHLACFERAGPPHGKLYKRTWMDPQAQGASLGSRCSALVARSVASVLTPGAPDWQGEHAWPCGRC